MSEPLLRNAEDIVTQIMTMHWDIAACPCWICVAGREVGLYPSTAFEKRPEGRAYVKEPK